MTSANDVKFYRSFIKLRYEARDGEASPSPMVFSLVHTYLNADVANLGQSSPRFHAFQKTFLAEIEYSKK